MSTSDKSVAVQRDEPQVPALSSDDVRAELDRIRPQVEELLPTRMDPERFLRVATKAILSNKTILQCDRLSIFSAIIEAAQLGLEPTGLLGSAYIVPYRVKGKLQAQLIPGYRGLIDLARRSEQVEAIWAHTVRERDEFDWGLGSEPFVTHRPFMPPRVDTEDPEAVAAADPGPYIAAYMVAVLRDRQGQPSIRQVEVMSYAEIEAVRKRSRASDGGPWVSDWSEMARKTVVRRGAKYLPLTAEAVQGFSLDEIAERAADAPDRPASNARNRLHTTLALRRGINVPPPEEAAQVDEAKDAEGATDDRS